MNPQQPILNAITGGIAQAENGERTNSQLCMIGNTQPKQNVENTQKNPTTQIMMKQ